MPVSNEPTMIAVSVRKDSKTNSVLMEAKNFSINWLNLSERKIVSQLSSGNNSSNKLKARNIPYFLAFGSPVLHASVAYAICQKESVLEAGDHDLFVGRLIGAMASLDFDENWKFEGYKPILYLGSNFRNTFSTLDRGHYVREK
jgi:flavin reductase (DIM6/NTAB) family NADH-FMN oxidoreductase RutF